MTAMSGLVFEVIVILLLLVANGLFAMTEIAIVSARRGRLRKLADSGDGRARAALELAESPNRFLATVQIGITLVGIIAGAYGGATLARELEHILVGFGPATAYARQLAFGIVVGSITYLSLVIGELVPKRIGLGHPEEIAMTVARFMRALSRAGAPVVAFLSISTDALLRLFGVKPQGGPAVSEEEVRVLMQEGLRAGAFHRVESEIVSSVLELDQIRVRDLMTPRPKVIFINRDDTHEQVWHKIVVSGHSYFPVYEGNRDQVVGIVSIKSIYANLAAGAGVRLKDLVVPALIVPASLNALQLLESLRKARKHLALVADEYGGIAGLVTLNDVMEAVVGDFATAEERARPSAIRRDDGSWLADGLISIDDLCATVPGLHFDSGTDYQTLAGYLIQQLGHVPREGEIFEAQGCSWEVLDMDRHRVDKVLIMPKPDSRSADR
jgi:putative hemolysin